MPNENERITAEHAGHGVWDFTCYLHPEIKGDADHLPGVLGIRQISGPRACIEVMKSHVDNAHPGIRMRLVRGTWSGLYRGRAERQMQRAGQR